MRKNQITNTVSILPPTYLLVCLIISLIIHWLWPIYKIASSCRWLGIGLIIIGIVINIWTDNLFKSKKTTVKPDQKPSQLITIGPFKFSRHPMYLGFVLILLGLALVLGSLSSFISPLLMWLILEFKFIPIEEKQLKNTFGQKYLDYKKQTRRWL